MNCRVHSYTVPLLEVSKPSLTKAGFKLKDGEPCGELCFRSFDETLDGVMEGVHWNDPADVEFLESVLKVDADMSPCALAIICRKPCLEVFIYRTRMFPDEKILKEQIIEEKHRHAPLVFVDDGGACNFTPLPPCSHNGPCDQTSECQCHLKSHHCKRSCRCSLKCPRRRKGCKCSHERVMDHCLTADCPCIEAGRECDPELCVKCDARGQPHKNKCQNTRIQRNQTQHIKIQPTKPAKYGLGAFATRELRAWTYIGEYVGEIRNLSSEESSQRSNILNKYTGLNYNFELNSSLTLDAARRGNETRYLNHSDKPNCDVIVKNVNDEHRIAIFTCENVDKGEELFLDYGPRYWQQYGNSSSIPEDPVEEDRQDGKGEPEEDDLEYI
ncbi:SET domain-containing protein [Desarmillaria tabescens]|uniref:SET domain-containing protein n=1 Tax=Armillaria tabescens TaxID=1929756 RepID=A0AA39NIC7_ARMTA|nr:SET domain-containing protein [Desarmillaria tabescens]KAK0466172.1 SET domain-containing protein [Desarmillaria tabescens]